MYICYGSVFSNFERRMSNGFKTVWIRLKTIFFNFSIFFYELEKPFNVPNFFSRAKALPELSWSSSIFLLFPSSPSYQISIIYFVMLLFCLRTTWTILSKSLFSVLHLTLYELTLHIHITCLHMAQGFTILINTYKPTTFIHPLFQPFHISFVLQSRLTIIQQLLSTNTLLFELGLPRAVFRALFSSCCMLMILKITFHEMLS